MREDKKEKMSKKRKVVLISIIGSILLVSGALLVEDTRRYFCRLTNGKVCFLLPPIRDLDGGEYIEIQKEKVKK